MTWVFAAVVVVVLGAIAVVASGRGGVLAETYDDRPDARVPAGAPLTSRDLRTVRFSTAVRGYRMSEVDALLDRLAVEMRAGGPLGGSQAGPGAQPDDEPGGEPGAQPRAEADGADGPGEESDEPGPGPV